MLCVVRALLLLRGSESHRLQWNQKRREDDVPGRALSQNQSPHLSPSCLARVTGELTMTFPAGIMRVYSGTPPPPVLSFRLVHTAPIEHFQPNADLLFRYC